MESLNKRQIGKQMEMQACGFLEAKGFVLLEENFQCYFGEIDLIMQDNEHVVFVEVRSRHSTYGNALESISKKKLKNLFKTANNYLQRQHLLYKVHSRFDLVVVQPKDGEIQIEWIKNAFWDVD